MNPSPFRHKPGTGRHMINSRFALFDDGKFQHGDPSDICILYAAHRLCEAFGLPPIWKVWSAVYQTDPMTYEAAQTILEKAALYTEPFDPGDRNTRFDILNDLHAIACPELADTLENLVNEKGALD